MKLDLLDPKVKSFVEKLQAQGGKPIYQLSPEDARKVLETVQSVKVAAPRAEIEDLMIPGPKEQVSVRIFRPEKSKERLPVIIHCHGGGWILGSKTTHDRFMREIAVGVHAAVVFVNYTPSPEAQYPVAVEQAYATAKYIAENADKHNVDSSRLVIAGDSVGGNMATVVAMLAKERKGPKIYAQFLFYPVTDSNFETGSYKEYAQGPWLSKPEMEWFWNAYEPNVKARKNYLLSPLQATLDQLKGLPPALVITDENDVLRDEGEAYAHKMMQAGVSVTAVRILGTMHDFMLLNPITETSPTRGAFTLAIAEIKKVFER